MHRIIIATWLFAAALLAMTSYPATSSEDATFKQYRAWIADARQRHPYAESADKMWRVMMCESSGRANAINKAGPYVGLFQYHAKTWAGNWNPYRDNSIYQAQAQIYATAAAWSLGYQRWWGCYKKALWEQLCSGF